MTMTFRDYSTGFILLSFTFAAIVSFSGSIFSNYDSNLQGQEEDVSSLNEKIKEAAPDTAQGENKANSINTESTGTFFLSSVLSVVETVTSGLGSLPNLLSVFVDELGVSEHIIMLASIPVAWGIWEVVSLYRGIRT